MTVDEYLAESSALYQGGDIAAARALALELLERYPAAHRGWRMLSNWNRKAGDKAEYLATLEAWQNSVKSDILRIEPLRLRAEFLASGNLADRVASVIARARLVYWDRKLRAGLSKDDNEGHVRLFLMLNAVPELIAHVTALSAEQVAALKPSLPLQIYFAGVREGASPETILNMFDGKIFALQERPHLLNNLADLAFRNGRFDLALESLNVLRRDKSQLDDKLFERLVRCHEELGNAEQVEQLLKDWEALSPEHPKLRLARIRSAIAIDDPLTLRRSLALLGRPVDLTPHETLVIADAFVRLDDLHGALEVLVFAEEAGTANPDILLRIAQIAAQIGEAELSVSAQQRELLRSHLNENLRSVVPEYDLLAHGGADTILSQVATSLDSDESAKGLEAIADLFLTVLERLVKTRSGFHRESVELHAFGSANWMQERGKALRAAAMIRVLCLTVLQNGEANDKILRILLRSQVLLGEDANAQLTRATIDLLRRMLPRPVPKPLRRELLNAALTVEDDALVESMQAEFTRDLSAVSVLRPVSASAQNDATLLFPAATYTAPITVAQGTGTNRVSLTLKTRDEHQFSPDEARIINACTLSPDEGHFLEELDINAYTGMMVDAALPEVAMDEELLFIPSKPAHYTNYFHFFGQHLPRLLALDAAVGERSAKVAIADYSMPFVTDLLALFGIGEDRIQRLAADRIQRVRRLYCLNPTSHDWLPAPEQVALMRQILDIPARTTNARGRRVYLARPLKGTRQSSRFLRNEAEIQDLVTRNGYEVVDPLSMSILEQRKFFAQCSVICGATGAALTNMVFLPGDARVICLTPHETCRTYYPGLAFGAGLQFSWILGKFEDRVAMSRKFPQLPYSVDPRALERIL